MRIFILACWIILAAPILALAQPVDENLPQVTGCIALMNANVTTAPGKAPIKATVIVRDGLITHIEQSPKIPADAYRVAADSFFVYPAFIDAFSSIGIKSTEGENAGPQAVRDRSRPTFDEEGNPSLEDAGITPFESIRPTFDPSDKSVADWRAQGFAIAHVVPKGKMIPGMGSVVILSGKNTDLMLWHENVSLFSQWSGAGGAYPATIIGVMAKWRELYTNAEQLQIHQASYDQASFVTRPNYNRAHEALLPVVNHKMPVFFRASKVKDISRVLTMQQDLGMNMVIADAEEAWYLKEKFASGKIPLVLSLDLPEEKKAEKESSSTKAAANKEGEESSSDAKAIADKEGEEIMDSIKVDPEVAAFEKRRAESLKAHLEQASVLQKEGISFSFGTMSIKSGDFSKNIQLMIQNGLSADQALQALTTQPAKLLGIEKYCGTIEPGKMANIIITTKPLFEKEAAIRYMMVEGALYEYEIKEKKKSGGKETAAAAGLINGTWEYTIDSPDQKREGKFVFSNGGSEVKGTITGENMNGGNDALEGIVIDGNKVSFTFDFEMGGQMLELEFDLKVDGESFNGTVTVGAFGTFPIKGQRTIKPE